MWLLISVALDFIGDREPNVLGRQLSVYNREPIEESRRQPRAHLCRHRGGSLVHNRINNSSVYYTISEC